MTCLLWSSDSLFSWAVGLFPDKQVHRFVPGARITSFLIRILDTNPVSPLKLQTISHFCCFFLRAAGVWSWYRLRDMERHGYSKANLWELSSWSVVKLLDSISIYFNVHVCDIPCSHCLYCLVSNHQKAPYYFIVGLFHGKLPLVQLNVSPTL